MKKTYQFIATIVLLLTGSLLLHAVPPMPGLELVEPKRPRLPFAFSNTMHGVKRQLVNQHGAPVINLAPRGLLILANFADTTFASNNTQLAFDSLANGDNYTYMGATGSCKAYFTAQSNGKYSPNFDVIGPVTLPHTSAYYGTDTKSGNGDDRYVVDFVLDACAEADKLGVDFSQYDNDEDGTVDFVYIIYAGFGQADGGAETTIWPHNWDLISALYYKNTNQSEYYAYYDDNDSLIYNLPTIDGKMLYTYACSNELNSTKARSGIGTICHEFTHVLGLPDYYITDDKYEYLFKYTPGAWSLMGYGNYLNNGNTPPNFSIFDKYYLGWVEPAVLNNNATYQLPADGKTGYMIARNDAHVELGPYRTDTVYYLENRQKEGWDEYLPGHGMLIWRVMYDEEKWHDNSPNDFKTRYRLICAQEDHYPYTTTSEERPEVPFPGSTNQTEFISFSPVNYLENIQESANGMITFDFVTENKTSVENVEINVNDASPSLVWYNLLGQPINPDTYKGIVIHANKKYLLR